jgi:alginate O-acetyltransferase complex protein AlgI
MIFSSYTFIFGFLPLSWLGWRLAVHLGGAKAAVSWLTLASLVFYSWWDWRYTPILLVSLVINYAIGRHLAAGLPRQRSRWLWSGLVWNLGLLGLFKYWNFFAVNVSGLSGAYLPVVHLALPLGISFFTFQKIAFLVDAWQGKIKQVAPGEFALFVMFFPQLIAGPIVHHGEFIPQLRTPAFTLLQGRRLALGLAVFSAGLFQKCAIADTLAPLADSAFGLTAAGVRLRFVEAWVGLLAYALQLFYDFAGYSHMALGLALLFGLKLPVNFLAPYTAGSLIEFWRRWHMTLSAFLRDYVYVPLGGNRCGPHRHLLNLLATMLVGGLWHGAGWTFVFWGLWHGVALCVNHLWRQWRGATAAATSSWWAHALTLLTVLFGWVVFRAPNLSTAQTMAENLLGLHGFSVPVSWMPHVNPFGWFVRARGLLPNVTATPIMLCVLVAAGWFACRGPGLLRWFGISHLEVTPGPSWQAIELAPAHDQLHWTRAAVAGLMFTVAVTALTRSTPFLYFQF